MKKAQTGFTLLELMMAITVLAILLAIAVPTFGSVIRSNRIATATNELVTALTLARSESMKRGDSVTVCASDDSALCAGSEDWSTGWIVFVDTDGNGSRGAGEPLLQAWTAIGAGLALDASVEFLQYTPTGLTSPVITNGSFELMKPGYGGDKARCIRIGNTGRVSTERETCT
ncbi:MAG: GspH/FimT family pseudopilin [Steroidobacteraceae bacterium]|nr:GspH/FimT family pseudopilin [Steroidobacteraceae bacterium]